MICLLSCFNERFIQISINTLSFCFGHSRYGDNCFLFIKLSHSSSSSLVVGYCAYRCLILRLLSVLSWLSIFTFLYFILCLYTCTLYLMRKRERERTCICCTVKISFRLSLSLPHFLFSIFSCLCQHIMCDKFLFVFICSSLQY